MSSPKPVWKKEIRYSYPDQIGHVIGVNGVNVKHWLTHLGCSTIIDDYKKHIVILGGSENAVFQTALEVQEKLLLFWRFSHWSGKECYQDLNTVIEEKDLEIDSLKQEIKDYREKQETIGHYPFTPKGWPEKEPYWA
jgi:hypothetical protein